MYYYLGSKQNYPANYANNNIYNYQPNYPVPVNYNNQINVQTYLDKQKLSLIQDQNSSNTIMCRILSELENLIIFLGYSGKKYFAYYATIPKNYEDIINQIIFQMTIFESSFKNFVKNNPNKEYNFPNNLQFVNIIDIVNNWKHFLEKKIVESNKSCYKESIQYYDEFLNILTNNNLSNNFYKKFKDLGKDSQKLSTSELTRVMNAGSTAICFTNEKYSDIEKEFMKNGDYKVNVVIGGDRKDNKFYNNIDKYDAQFNNLKNKLYDNLNLMLGYLEKYCILNANLQNAIQPNYSNKIKDYFKNSQEIFKKYEFYLDNFYNVYNKINEEFNFELPNNEKKTIVSDINKWKLNITNINIKKELDNAINVIYKDKEPKNYNN